jgi:hypothetical protein
VLTNSTTQTPAVQDHERPLLQPWFDLTGLDESSPEWGKVWRAITSAGLANGHGLILWPTPAEAEAEVGLAQTIAARTIRVAMEAGARCAKALPVSTHSGGTTVEHARSAAWPVSEDLVPMTESLGVEVVLGLLHKVPSLVQATLSLSPQASVQRILAEIGARVVGVFADAPSALLAEIGLVRSVAAASGPEYGGPWHPLIELILQEVVNEDIFSEHVFLRLRETGVGGVDFVVLPSGNWMTFRLPNETAAGS